MTTTTPRHDGWTGERQRAFLEAVAVGATVEEACGHVGMSVSSAYALRRRAAGAAFALGWQAAGLLARDRIADALTTRALAGQTETVTRADGSTISRHRFDNRLAATMLARLDRQAEDTGPAHSAARIIAGGWDAWLAGMATDDSPAAAGVFLQRRGLADAGSRPAKATDARDLAPLLALASADRWLRVGADLAGDVDIADLDPAARAHWTAEQWTRAEAAGLLRFATPEDYAPTPPLPPLQAENAVEHVWDCPDLRRPVTDFPPPEDFDGYETGTWGEDGYHRDLSPNEAVIAAAYDRDQREEDGEILDPVRAAAARDAWFAEMQEVVVAHIRGTRAGADGLSGPIPSDASNERQNHGNPVRHQGDPREDPAQPAYH